MKKLDRTLNLGAVITVSLSAMLGSGIFVLPGIAFGLTGPSLYLAYLVAMVGILPAALSKSELATAMPESGGTYVYLERTFGPFAGTIAGLGLWLSLLFKSAFALVGFASYLSIFTNLSVEYASVSLLIIITLLNMMGVGKVTKILFFVVILSLTSVAFISVISVPSITMAHFEPLLSNGYTGLFSCAATVYISYAGVTKVAAIAEEVIMPEKNIPRGIMISLAIVGVVYAFANYALAGSLSPEELNNNYKPFYTLGLKNGGYVIGTGLAIVAILTMTSMANAGLLAASRFPFAMSRDRLLPSYFGAIHHKYFTPTRSIILSAVLIGASILTLEISKIVKLASVFMIIMFIMVNLTVIILRETNVQWYKPQYKSPMYPFMQIFGIAVGFAMLYTTGEIAYKAVLGILVPGSIMFIFYSRNRTDRKGVWAIRGRRNDLITEEEGFTNRTELSFQLDTFSTSMDARVVVALFGKEVSSEMLIEKGISLADHGNIEVAHITEIPEQINLEDYTEESPALRSLRRRVIALAIEKNEPLTFDPVTTHDIVKTIYNISQRVHCNWLLLEWKKKKAGSVTFHTPVGWLKNHLQCDLAMYNNKGIRYIRKIMALLDGNPNDELVISTSQQLARTHQGEVTFISVLNSKSSEKKIQETENRLRKVNTESEVHSTYDIINSDDLIEAINDTSVEYDLLIFGGSDYYFINNFVANIDEKIMSGAACSVLSVYKANAVIPEESEDSQDSE